MSYQQQNYSIIEYLIESDAISDWCYSSFLVNWHLNFSSLDLSSVVIMLKYCF